MTNGDEGELIPANKARSLSESYNMFLDEIEEQIVKASKNRESSISVTVGDWNEDDFRRGKRILEDDGYTIKAEGCAGWSSYYYKISW